MKSNYHDNRRLSQRNFGQRQALPILIVLLISLMIGTLAAQESNAKVNSGLQRLDMAKGEILPQNENLQRVFNTTLDQMQNGVGARNLLLYQDFSNEFPPQGWIIIDADGDGFNWQKWSFNEPNWCAGSASNDGGPLTPDNYMITSALTLPTGIVAMAYLVRSFDDWAPIETYSVLISTTTPTIEAFTTIWTETMEVGGITWYERFIDLSAYSGQTIYIAFRHHDSFAQQGIGIDNVQVFAPVDYDLAALTISGSLTPTVDIPQVYTVKVRNEGSLSADGYTVRLMQGSTQLASVPGVALDFWETFDFIITWSPSTAGNTDIYGEIAWSDDLNEENNQTATMNLDVQPAGIVKVYIGEPTSWWSSNEAVINYSAPNSVSQTLYFDHELPSAGNITHLQYLFNGDGDIPDNVPVRFYIASTDRTNLYGNWIAYEEFTLVFEGSLPVSQAGQYYVPITLDTPFPYNGGNIAIMAHRPWDENTYSWTNGWHQTTDHSGGWRQAGTLDDWEVFDLNNLPSGFRSNGYANVTIQFSTAGRGILQGTVTHEGVPVEGAIVKINEYQQYTITDTAGYFAIPLIEAGTISITASKYLFKDTVIGNIVIAAGGTTTQNITLENMNYDLNTLSVSGSSMPSVGAETPYTVVVRNDGINNISGGSYTVRLMQVATSGQDIVLMQQNGQTLSSTTAHSFEFLYAPTLVGVFEIYGSISYTNDENPANDDSEMMKITVFPSGYSVDYVGDPESEEFWIYFPFHYRHANNLSQTIYLDEEIDSGGFLSSIAYRIENSGNIPENELYRVYVAATEQNAFGDFIDPTSFTQVFEGTLPLTEEGQYDVVIPFETPFAYHGGNLALMTQRVYTTGWDGGRWNEWHQTWTDQARSYVIFSDTEITLPYPVGDQFSEYRLPNTSLIFDTNGTGVLTGVVSHNSVPLPDVLISIEGTKHSATTDDNGVYTVRFIHPGSKGITARLHGYFDYTTTINILPDQEITHNITLVPRPVVNVLGTVVALDTGAPLSGASISLTGYDNFTATTNAQGQFTISGVYTSLTYTLIVRKQGYESYENTLVEVGSSDLNLGTISLQERAYPPSNVVAVEAGNAVNITWNPDSTEAYFTHSQIDYFYDAVGTWGAIHIIIAHRFTQAQLQAKGVANGTLTKVYFMLNTPINYANIKIYTGGSIAPLNPGSLIHEQPVSLAGIQYQEWIEVELTTELDIPKTGEIWIGVEINASAGLPIGSDTGPAISGYGNIVYEDNSWKTMDELGIFSNWMIKGLATGVAGVVPLIAGDYGNNPVSTEYILSDNTALLQKPENRSSMINDTKWYSENGIINRTDASSATTDNPLSIVHYPLSISNRVRTGFNVYRMKMEETGNEALWTTIAENVQGSQIADNTWNDVDDGGYRYAVKAIYNGDYLSMPAFSNVVGKNMTSAFTVNIQTADGSPVAGAEVRLVNNNGNPAHIYQATATSNAVIFPNVWFGNYSLSVSLAGFKPFFLNSLGILVNPFSYDVLFHEKILLFESFEEEFPPAGWISIDADGDGWEWMNLGFDAHTGWVAPSSASWFMEILFPDNYFITPPINLTGYTSASLSYYIAAQDPGFPFETYSVMISTTTPEVNSFVSLHNETLNSDEWLLRDIDLSNYVDMKVYIAFRHHDCSDMFFIKLDDVSVYASDYTSEDDFSIPPIFTALKGNYPNPFNPTTNIVFDLQRESNVRIDVYNIRGQRVRVLVDEEFGAGSHTIVWNGEDENGREVSSGVYFYQMRAGSFSEVKRMVLLK